MTNNKLKPMSMLGLVALAGVVLLSGVALAAMSSAQKVIYDSYAAQAKAQNASFDQFSAERGKAFFLGKHTGGKPDTASCTACHTTDLTKAGKTRAGKEIAPMAASVSPQRYTVAADVEKWFKRNCSDVLGRECTALEKGDSLAYLLGL